MKTLAIKLLMFSTLIIGATGLTGCIQDEGTEETGGNGGQQIPPPDIYVPPIEPPTEPPTDPIPEEPDDGEFQEGGISVVGGVKRTRLNTVNIAVDRSFFHNMRIGFDPNCENGDWVPIEDVVEVTLKQNTENVITAQLADFEGARSDCFQVSVVHDNLGPEINLIRYPAPVVEEGSSHEIEYAITDASAIESAQCGLNGNVQVCPKGQTVVGISALPVGQYSFTVRARDELGNQSEVVVNWQAVASTRHLVQSFSLDNYRKVDILIVIDNSGSMEYEQRNMAQRVRNFLSILRGLDWQIGVTTTDARNVTLGDGRLIPIYGTKNDYLFNSSMDEEEAQRLLGLTLQRKETGSGSEQGIRATYRAIERALASPNSDQGRLFRPGAQFATLVISDENESASTEKNDPHNLVQLVSEAFNGQKSFSFHSIITRPNDKACLNGEGYSYGHRYQVMSELTGGVVGSVCEMDYAAQLTGIAESVRDLLKTLTLQCEPLAQLPILVTHNGQTYNAPFRVEGVNLRFETELPPGNFSVDYHCLR